ncbi:MAG: AAA domain-containing protein [Coleofasciculus sp. G1-WW12-02]|uniref:AAA domain-containing protein n=1 Tax=Coleofasciculus sp. G1-WW12-02 TaxID=3068483 RepID=UPI0032F5D0E8
MLNEARKVDAILDAWFDYIALDDYSNARIEVAEQYTVNLVRDNVLIKPATFSELQLKVNQRQQGQQEAVWVLSFPQVLDVEKGKTHFCPLFSLDVTSILKGEYQEQGWNLDSLKLIEAGDNLATFLGLDDEQREQLITQDGLRRFLETTFELTFDTYQEWMERVVIPRRSRNQIQRQPYLFKFLGGRFSGNLRRDLKDIKSGSKKWLNPGHPAYEYLHGVPQLREEHEVTYMGAFPTKVPSHSQLTVLKHAQTEPMTAVQGPPGSGKTTLILHIIAQQVVKRALSLIEVGEDINNLTFVSSTNNKAVENVIEKLDELLQQESSTKVFFYLKGGSKTNITSAGGAIEQLQQAIDYLNINDFDENKINFIQEQIIRIKHELLAEESNYLGLRRQRALDEERLPHLLEKIPTLRHSLEEAITARNNFQGRANELADYEQLPIDAYRKIDLHFDNAERQLPEGRLPWWIRLWHWLTGKTEKQIVDKAALACQSAIENTFNTPFPVANPRNRIDLIQQARLVRGRLNKADELITIQGRLQELANKLSSTERERYEVFSEITAIERKLETPLEDFYASFHQNFHDKHKELFQLSQEFLTQQALQHKGHVKSSLELYSSILSGNRKDKYKMAENLDEHIKALSLMFPVITGALLSIRNMLPWVEECVDRTIVDEAGMIPLHQTFPLLVRSHKAIIVGDPLQIEPIISLSDQRRHNYRQTAFLDRGLTEIDYHRYSPEEEYSATSYHRAAGASGEDNDKGQGICLTEHYRCQHSIIQYCNKIANYGNYGLEVKSEPVTPLLESNLIAYHVEGNIKGNVNEEEVDAICDLIQHLCKKGYSLEDIGVISAFRAQADALRQRLPKQFPGLDKKSIGTIHTFQGSEKKVIILSTKICRTQDNVNWINRRPNLLNVAVSRAKELFILMGNIYRLEKAGSYTRQLVEHIREHGYILEYKPAINNPYQSSSSSLVCDCEHLDYFNRAIQEVEQELIIVTPWIRGDEPKKFADSIVSAVERGVNVTVIYGYLSHENGNDANNDDNDAEAEKKLKDVLGSSLLRSRSGGTNQRILFWDNKFAVVGSWNWLSHQYRDFCNKSLVNPAFQIRRETSVCLSDYSTISLLKEDIDGFIQEYF